MTEEQARNHPGVLAGTHRAGRDRRRPDGWRIFSFCNSRNIFYVCKWGHQGARTKNYACSVCSSLQAAIARSMVYWFNRTIRDLPSKDSNPYYTHTEIRANSRDLYRRKRAQGMTANECNSRTLEQARAAMFSWQLRRRIAVKKSKIVELEKALWQSAQR